MSSFQVTLDAGAFDVIDTDQGQVLRQLLRQAAHRGWKVCCAAVTLAEVCRGPDRTRRVEAALVRDRERGGRRIEIVPTDERMAKLVGAILHASGRGSEHLADAHVVAVCAPVETAVVVTSDAGDITTLAAVLPGTRVVTRRP